MSTASDLARVLLLEVSAPGWAFALAAVAILFFGAYEGSRDYADIEANDPTRHMLAGRARGAAVSGIWVGWAISSGPGLLAAVAGLLALMCGYSLALDTRLNFRRKLPLTYIGKPSSSAAATDGYLQKLAARYGLARVSNLWFVARVVTYLGGTLLAVLRVGKLFF